MIVNLKEEGWEIIYHRAHALLAAQLAGQWHEKNTPVRLIETIAAISHHDDLEREWEGNELTSAGAPLDFTLNNNTSIEKLEKLVEGALYRSRWVALLVSMHISFLTETKRGESLELDQFLDEQRLLQKRWHEELSISEEEGHSAYQFMRWCDRLSLILCQGHLPAAERKLEITTGPDHQQYDVMQFNTGEVCVLPWPFKSDRFTVQVEASYLSQLKFDSHEEFINALKDAPRRFLEWTFVQPIESNEPSFVEAGSAYSRRLTED